MRSARHLINIIIACAAAGLRLASDMPSEIELFVDIALQVQ